MLRCNAAYKETWDLWSSSMQCPPSGSATDQAWEHTQEQATAPAAPGVSPSPEEHKPGTELILHVSEQNNIERVINISYRDGTLVSLTKHLLTMCWRRPAHYQWEGRRCKYVRRIFMFQFSCIWCVPECNWHGLYPDLIPKDNKAFSY